MSDLGPNYTSKAEFEQDLERGLEQAIGARFIGTFLTNAVLRNTVLWGAAFAAVLYLAQHAYEDTLKRIREQQDKLYAPVLGQSEVNDVIWGEFGHYYWRPPRQQETAAQSKNFFNPGQRPSAEDITRWRSWMKSVFEPMNSKMEEIITQNSAYLAGGHLPYRWKLFIFHTESYRKTIADWKDDDETKRPELFFDPNASLTAISYPDNMTRCADGFVNALKEEENRIRYSFLAAIRFSPPEVRTPASCERQPREPDVPD